MIFNMEENFICTVCGYIMPDHFIHSYRRGIICYCCGYEFGIDEVNISYMKARKEWIRNGMESAVAEYRLKGIVEWRFEDAIRQLENLKKINKKKYSFIFDYEKEHWDPEYNIDFALECWKKREKAS